MKSEDPRLLLNVYVGVDKVLYGTIAPGDMSFSDEVLYNAVLTNGMAMRIDSDSSMRLYDEDNNLIVVTSVWEISAE